MKGTLDFLFFQGVFLKIMVVHTVLGGKLYIAVERYFAIICVCSSLLSSCFPRFPSVGIPQ